jgi:hypothetical protein
MPQKAVFAGEGHRAAAVEVLQRHEVEQQRLGMLWIEGTVRLRPILGQYDLLTVNVRQTPYPLRMLLQAGLDHTIGLLF